MAGVSTLHTPAPAGPGVGAWVVYVRSLLKGQVTWTGEPGWALSRGAAPALCFLEQAAEGRGLWLRSLQGSWKRGVEKGRPSCPRAQHPTVYQMQYSSAYLPDQSDCQPRGGLRGHCHVVGTGS